MLTNAWEGVYRMKFRDIYKLLKPYVSIIRILSLYVLLLSVISIVTPFLNSFMIDRGLLRQDIPTVSFFVLLLILLQALDSMIQYLQTKQEIILTNMLGRDLKVKALSHGLKLNPEHFKEQDFYKTISDALYDIGNIMDITSSNFLFLFITIGLFLLDWKLALFITTFIPIKILFNIRIRARAEKLGKELMLANKNYNTWFSDLLTGVIDIKLWNLYSRKIEEYEEHVENINEASKNLTLLNAENSRLMKTIELMFVNAMYILGAYLIRGNHLSLGNLFTFITFSGYLLVPVDMIMDLRITLKRMAPSAEAIKSFFSLEEENYASTLLPPPRLSKIEFQNVSVLYDNRAVLKNINLEINRGAKVAIVGENGSGKTTLLNLLLGLCRPSDGVIRMDGISISEYNIEEYRKKFSVVVQNIHLFRGTVKGNITLDDRTAIFSERCIPFCDKAIRRLDKQYDTSVGSEGTKLSGGEKQKIGLLRALHRKAEILILDEASSNYDKESEACFNLFIETNHDYGFYFIVTHRKELLAHMDKIIYLSDGKITHIETHP